MSKASADYPGNVLRDLASPETSARLKASKHLESELRKTTTKQRKMQFGNKKTTSALLALLDDPDPRIVHNAVVALARIACYYCKDDRAYPKMLQLAHSKHPLTQPWAINALISLRGESSLDDVLPFCRDQSQQAREMTLYHLFRWLMEMRTDHSGSIRPENQQRLRAVALRSLDDAKSLVRGMAAYLLREVGDITALAALRARLKKERNRDTKQSINEAIEWLEARL
jgi:HEAT repeat protein